MAAHQGAINIFNGYPVSMQIVLLPYPGNLSLSSLS